MCNDDRSFILSNHYVHIYVFPAGGARGGSRRPPRSWTASRSSAATTTTRWSRGRRWPIKIFEAFRKIFGPARCWSRCCWSWRPGRGAGSPPAAPWPRSELTPPQLQQQQQQQQPQQLIATTSRIPIMTKMRNMKMFMITRMMSISSRVVNTWTGLG